MTTLDLTLLFLNYNTPEWISLALTSLQQQYLNITQLKIEVIVVDNASTDDSVATIKKKFPWVKLIISPKNGGFAAGNNLGLSAVKSRYVMLVNSDVEFTAHSNLDELVLYLDAHLEAGVITPKVLLANGQLDPASHRGEPTPWASFTYFTGGENLLPQSKLFGQYHQSYKDKNIIHTIDACSGAAMMVRTAALKHIGKLDERFFMYAEDLDWCRRFRQKNYTIIFYPQVTVRHHKYKSGRGHNQQLLSQRTSQQFYQTMLQYFDKYYRSKYPIIIRWGIQFFIWYKTR